MSSQSAERVVVTGIGLVTPFAADREASWTAIREGQRACRWVDLSLAECSDSVAAATPRLRVAGAPAALRPATQDDEPIISLALHAAAEAWDHAQLSCGSVAAEKLGCVIGTSKGGLQSFSRLTRTTNDELSSKLWRQCFPDSPAVAVARQFGIGGPVLCPVAACATGLASLNRGCELIRDGTCDVVLAGSTDASLTPVVVGSFQRLGVLGRAFDDPAEACRPFDVGHNGFSIGEGAAVVVLESLTHARRRHAAILAEWLAGWSLSDAAGLTHLDRTGEGLARLIHDVVGRAGLSIGQIDYINLHGTGTVENDLSETAGICRAFGPAECRVPGSSLKGAIGHLLGAAGSVEAAATILAMRDSIIPPTVNLNHAAPGCDLDYTPKTARHAEVRYALKLSLGFGGHLTAAVLARSAD